MASSRPMEARAFFVAAEAGRSETTRRPFGEWRSVANEPGSSPPIRQEARPCVVTPAAGRREGSRRIFRGPVHPSSPQPQASARSPAGSPGDGLYSDGRPESASLPLRRCGRPESAGTSPVPSRRYGRARRAAPSDVRAVECIVGASQSPCPLLRHHCGRPATRAPSNVSAMMGSPGPTTVGPMGGSLVPRRRCSRPEGPGGWDPWAHKKSARTSLLPKTASVRGPVE